ncbi:acyl-CoA N-acyltransferase [Phyllosticta citriasiana]|uniref:histone acetyltransferase n=1 Tax=Phyllosticta citriasiana TaxID=595635 RepID=A0ABR1KE65_9PEZI
MGPEAMQAQLPTPSAPNPSYNGGGGAPAVGVANASTPTATPNQRPATMEPNVIHVVLGDLLIKPWYPSFYPEELVGRRIERLYVCQWCFKYSKELIPFLGHTKVCPLKEAPPPGTKIYAKDSYSIHEVDGEQHKLYSQNLSLFGKLFLDTKSVFYDVTTFLYYLLISTNPTTGARQVTGFFSKEKMSWDNNNLACILVFPPWQRQGLGQMLMGISYELSRREGRIGGPEKPLSELGRRGYTAYWSATIARVVLAVPGKGTLTLRDLSDATYILIEDIVATLKSMAVLEHRPGGKKGAADDEAVLNKAKLRRWALEHGISLVPPVDPAAFVGEGESMEGVVALE